MFEGKSVKHAFSFIRCTFELRSLFFFFFINRRDTLSHFSRIIVACEYSRFSLLGTSRQEERLRFSDSKTQLLFLEPKNIFLTFTTPFISDLCGLLSFVCHW